MVEDLSSRFGWSTDFGIASDSMETFYSRKHAYSISTSLNGLKSDLRRLSGFQDLDEKVKIAVEMKLKEQLYSGETLICSCSAEQGETFEPSSCSL